MKNTRLHLIKKSSSLSLIFIAFVLMVFICMFNGHSVSSAFVADVNFLILAFIHVCLLMFLVSIA